MGLNYRVNTRFYRYLHYPYVVYLDFHEFLNVFRLIFRFVIIWSQIAAMAVRFGLQSWGLKEANFMLRFPI